MSGEATPQTPATNTPAAPPAQPVATPPATAPAAPVVASPVAAPPAAAPDPQQKLNLPGAEPPATSAGSGDDPNPPWLPDRLKQARGAERNALLKDLGITDISEAKAAIEAHKAAIEAQKTIEQRAAEADARAKQYEERFAGLMQTVKQRAEADMQLLSPEQQAFILKVAGDDPARQLDVINAAMPTWAQAEPAQPPAPPPAPPPQPASTVPEVPRPPAPNGGAAKTKYEEWVALRDDPSTTMRASLFYRTNRFEIDRSRPKEN